MPVPQGVAGAVRRRGGRGRARRSAARSGSSSRRSTPAAAARASSRNSPPTPRAASASPSRSTRCDAAASEMLGNTLVTDPDRRRPASRSTASTSRKARDIEREFYLSMLVDRATGARRLRRLDRRRHGHRGRRARHAREDRHVLDRPGDRLSCPIHGRQSPRRSASTGDLARQATQADRAILYDAFIAKDMSLLEINPLIVTKDGQSAAASTPR